MAMKRPSDPRRVYLRGGMPILCYGGLYFGLSRGTTKVNLEDPVTVEVRKRDHGKSRITVTQGHGENAVSENWTEQSVVFAKRTPKVAVEPTPALDNDTK